MFQVDGFSRDQMEETRAATCQLCCKKTVFQFRMHALWHMKEKKFYCGSEGCVYAVNKKGLMQKHLAKFHWTLSQNSFVDREEEVNRNLKRKLKECFPNLVVAESWERRSLEGRRISPKKEKEGGKHRLPTSAPVRLSLREKEDGGKRRLPICEPLKLVSCPYCKIFVRKGRTPGRGIHMHVLRKHPKMAVHWKANQVRILYINGFLFMLKYFKVLP